MYLVFSLFTSRPFFLLAYTEMPSFICHDVLSLFVFPTREFRSVFMEVDNSVGIALDYGLDDRGSRVRFPAGAGNFSLHHCVQNGSGAHPFTYPVGTRSSFPGGKAALA
jgi:hypothetical protein